MARLDPPVVILVASVRRVGVPLPVTLIVHAWIVEPGRRQPVYERPVFALERRGGETWVVRGVPDERGQPEDLWLIETPDAVGHSWSRATSAIARGEASRP